MPSIVLRTATAGDVGILLQLIRELTIYEKAPDAVVASEADLLGTASAPSAVSRRCSPSLTKNPPASRCSFRISQRGSAVRDSTLRISSSPNGRATSVLAAGLWGESPRSPSNGNAAGSISGCCTGIPRATSIAASASSILRNGSPTARAAPHSSASRRRIGSLSGSSVGI